MFGDLPPIYISIQNMLENAVDCQIFDSLEFAKTLLHLVTLKVFFLSVLFLHRQG